MVLLEAILSPALQVLFDKLASGDIMEFFRRSNFNDRLIEKLKIAYFTNTAALDDAEQKQHNNPAIETWLDMLKDSIYEAEDVLDELATKALQWELEVSSQNFSNQVRNWNLVSTLNPFREGIELRIENVIGKLEYISKQKDILGLKGEGGRRFGIIQRTPTTSLLIESHVYGRDHDVEELVKLLLTHDETSKDAIGVIPILGMGGIGKTTLAQCVFNDKRMDGCFHVKAWACVSNNFDVVSITKAILESATNEPWNTMNLELLQGSLAKQLSKKKFLIVLDDLWNESYDKWNELLIPFKVGAVGSRIVVTARNEEVVLAMNAYPPYYLKELSNDACWSLFLQHAFRNSGDRPDLKSIGREIVKKCKGLPLAAKSLGGNLGSKLDTNHWNNILNSNIWELPFQKCNILPSLILSYHHLPANLKQCFAYCSIFPKDYEFDRKQLVLLWMAEGFVPQVEESKTMEEVGEEFFCDLLSRSFFQESPSSKSRYVMHDLINDLAQFVSRKMCIRLEDKSESCTQNFAKRVRHFSFIRRKYDVYGKFEALSQVKWLRTFLPFESEPGIGFCYLSNKVTNDLLPKLKCLRVVSLRGYCITELPSSIRNLKHLRYLDLSHTAIKGLPESICSLCNLQSLMLNNCDSLVNLPIDLGNLVNLRYLDISQSGLQEMPFTISRMRSLRTLPEFIVGQDRSMQIGDLRDMRYIQGTLTISKLENVVNAWDARRANLTDKQFLHELVIEWSSNFDGMRNEMVDLAVLEMLQPHRNLEKISVKSYGGLKFPTWLGDPSFSNMLILECSNCKNCTILPPLGQLPSLKKLAIKGMYSVKSVGVEFYGNGISFIKPFPSLETLRFEEMLEWEHWFSSRGEEEIEVFPCLRELFIEQCPRLQGKLPNHLPSLTKLVIHDTERLKSPVPMPAALLELDLKGCDEVVLGSAVNLTSLDSLHICDISKLTHLSERLTQQLAQLKSLQITDCSELKSLWKNEVRVEHLTSLRRLVIRNCPSLVSLLGEEEQLPITLEYLEIEYCHNLERLPFEMHRLTSLQELTIKDSPRLISFPDANFPPNLKGLSIRRCSFESLPEGIIHNFETPLQYMYISGCYYFTSFSSESDLFPTTFEQLTIDHCPNLESLPQGMMHSNNLSLKDLEIFDCSSLSSFPRGQLPRTLKALTIWNCMNLESLADVMTQDNMSLETFRVGKCPNLKFLPNGLHKLLHLDYLEIDGCPGLLSFPEGGFPVTSLKKVYIFNCESLKSLPDHMQNLTSLQELHISDCPAILSFPEGGFPVNLTSLEIKDCKNIGPLSEWGLHRLTSLRKLSITGGCADLSSFQEYLLSPTLTSLDIGKLVSLDSLSNWLPNLTSLEDLKIKECHKLHSLPVEGLPATLSRLEISDCPLLEKQCEKDWPKIEHIPCILM